MSASKPYTRESIAHALAHHESRGAIESVSPPEPGGRSTWRVRVPSDVYTGTGVFDLTMPQAYAFVIGLRAGELREHRTLAAIEQATPPPCVDDVESLQHEVDLLRSIVRSLSMRADVKLAEPVDPLIEGALRRALDEVKRPIRCGVHGDDTTSGRCFSCDVDLLREQLRLLDNAQTFTAAEGPFERVVALCERQPRLIPVVLAWANTAGSEGQS